MIKEASIIASDEWTGEHISSVEWTQPAWSDLCLFYLHSPLDFTKNRLLIRLHIEGEPATLRVAVGSSLKQGDWSECAAMPLDCQPGMNEFRFGGDTAWRPVRGDTDLRQIDHLTIGGEASNTRVTLWACLEEIATARTYAIGSIGRDVSERPFDRPIPTKATDLLRWTTGLFMGQPAPEGFADIADDFADLRNLFPREYWSEMEALHDRLSGFLLSDPENKISLEHITRMIALIQPGIDAVRLQGARTIEIGCGGTNPLATSLFFYLNGAAECWAVDIEPLRNEAHAAKGLLRLLSDAMINPARWNVSGIDSAEFLRRIQQCDFTALSAGRLYDGVKNLPLRHIVSSLYDLPDTSFDFMYSIDVLEHVDFYREAAKKLASVLAPGGVMCHHIDFSDHLFASGRSPHRWNFMVTDGGPGGGINRIRLSQWLDAFSIAGMATLQALPVMEEPPVGVFDRLAPEYAHLSKDDIKTLCATIILRKP